MPCRPWQEEQLDLVPEHPVTLTKPTRNDGASHADQDAEGRETESDREEDLGATKIRRARHVLQYVVVKRWATGERADFAWIQLGHSRACYPGRPRVFFGEPHVVTV